MKKLKFVLVIVAVLIVGLLVAIATRPADFRVTRSATIAAPPRAVFDQVNNLKKWDAWSPWARLDPNAKNSFEGPESGVGAAMLWSGNSKVGEGRMTITESSAPEALRMRLEFIRPMESVSDTEFTFKPDGEKTVVTWTMTGTNNFMGKAFSLFVDCDKLVGGDFEKGLAAMRTVAEANPSSTAEAKP